MRRRRPRRGIFTLPEMELPFGELAPLMDEIQRVACEIVAPRQVPRDARRRALDHAAARRRRRRAHTRACRVLQIDAHADLRDCYMGTPHNHACAMRRTLEYAPVTQVGIRSMSTEEAEAAPDARARRSSTTYSMRRDPTWIDAVVDTLPRHGLPHDRRRRHGPGDHAGHRHAGARRPVLVRDRSPSSAPPSSAARVVACDVVELSPLPGMMAPNFLCAKLVYKILTYRFADAIASATGSSRTCSGWKLAVNDMYTA